MGINIVRYNGMTLVDMTAATVTPETLAEGVTAFDAAGNLIIGTAQIVPVGPAYTNLVPTSIAWLESGIYNGVGYKDGVYYSSSSLNADANYTSTGLIQITADANGGTVPLYLKGCEITSESHCRITLFDSGKTRKTQVNGFLTSTTVATVTKISDGYYRIQLADMGNYGFDGSSFYVAFSVKGSGANLIVTANEPIE